LIQPIVVVILDRAVILAWQGYIRKWRAMTYQATAQNHTNLQNLSMRRASELEYLSDMLPQLRQMALGLGEHTLARLLEIAMMEAQLQFDLANMQDEVE